MPSASDTNPQKIALTRTSTLLDCERVLKSIATPTGPTIISLPSDDRRVFLKDLRMAAIISAASIMPEVKCEWSHQVSAETHESLVGLAGAVYGVPLAQGHKFVSIDEAKQTLARRLGILEDPPGSKETLTFCAIDEATRSQPVALAGQSGRAAFTAKFGKFVEKYFDEGTSKMFSSHIGPSLFDAGPLSVADHIYGFVYELYQNTFNHGSLDENQQTIPGLRLIRLRKRGAHAKTRDAFIRGAHYFPELARYLQQVAPSSKSFKFYEISISDNGMGIVSRFRTTTHAGPESSSSTGHNLELLNHIIAESLSSDVKKSQIGEGGLQKALRAVDSVKGFVSLRSDNLWVYRSPTDSNGTSQDKWLRPVANSEELSTIPGTHFSLLILAS